MSQFIWNLFLASVSFLLPIIAYAVRSARSDFKIDYFFISNRQRFYSGSIFLLLLNILFSFSPDFADIVKIIGFEMTKISAVTVGGLTGAWVIGLISSEKK